VAFESVLAKDLSPEEQRQWLNTFEKCAPDNALANYLSAFNYFQAGQTDQAVPQLIAASGKGFYDYTSDRVQDDAEAYLSAVPDRNGRDASDRFGEDRGGGQFLGGGPEEPRQPDADEHTRQGRQARNRIMSNFLSAKVKSCCSEGESPSGLAESRRSLERKN
jgi:hypothetical protein